MKKEYETFQEYKDWLAKDNNWAYYTKADFTFSSPRTEIVGIMDIANGMDILEVGCADGKTLGFIKERFNVKLYGIEPDEENAKLADSHGDIFHGTVEDFIIKYPDKRFDGIIMADVIEHLLEPWSVVRDVAGMLKTGGSIYASIPNFFHATVIYNLFKTGSFAYHSSDLINKDHLRFFTFFDAMILFVMSGLKPVFIGGIRLPIENDYKKLDELIEMVKPILDTFARNDYYSDFYQLIIKATKE